MEWLKSGQVKEACQRLRRSKPMDSINLIYIVASVLATIITIVVMLITPIAKLTGAITKLETTLAHNMEHTLTI